MKPYNLLNEEVMEPVQFSIKINGIETTLDMVNNQIQLLLQIRDYLTDRKIEKNIRNFLAD